MNIKQYLKQTLSNKEILELLPDKRVFFLHANNPNKNLYLEYEIINEFGEEYAEGEEKKTHKSCFRWTLNFLKELQNSYNGK